MEPRPIFVLDESLFAIMNLPEVHATYLMLHERRPQSCYPPFSTCFLEFDHKFVVPQTARWCLDPNNPRMRLRVHWSSDCPMLVAAMPMIPDSTGQWSDWHEAAKWSGSGRLTREESNTIVYLDKWVVRLWLCALATRNLEKETRRAKGMWKRKNLSDTSRPTHVTTLRVPAVQYLPGEDGRTPTGRNVRPHWRMPHWRRQHHGPKNSLIKDVYIEGVFVKIADAEEISLEKTYKIVA